MVRWVGVAARRPLLGPKLQDAGRLESLQTKEAYPYPAINLKQSNPSIVGQLIRLDGNDSFEPQFALLANGKIVISVSSISLPNK